MKKILASIILALIIICGISIYSNADFSADNIRRFQPYTNVDLEVLINAGFKCKYDDFSFSAWVTSPYETIIQLDPSGTPNKIDEYKISFAIKLSYNAGKCNVFPCLEFSRKGEEIDSENLMDTVFFKIDENRYIIDVTGSYCTFYAWDGEKTINQDHFIMPLLNSGSVLLEDIATTSSDIIIRIDSNNIEGEAVKFNESNKRIFKYFYEKCNKAGIFDQEVIQLDKDRVFIKTYHNDSSKKISEDVYLGIDGIIK